MSWGSFAAARARPLTESQTPLTNVFARLLMTGPPDARTLHGERGVRRSGSFRGARAEGCRPKGAKPNRETTYPHRNRGRGGVTGTRGFRMITHGTSLAQPRQL